MRLKSLEIQGFKTFADRTRFLFSEHGKTGITAIVGPNGSGKSNAADAIRWVMGEQSLRLLRGKRAEDVIFSGSSSRPRSGYAEVILTFISEKTGAREEVTVGRRLYREGESEYILNGQPARLQDVVLFLAQAGIAQRSYAVIGQGMADAVLIATPSERRDFFDEAFGLKPFLLKKHSSEQRLEEVEKHLSQTALLLSELEPRLTSLEKQVRRFRERDQLATELAELELDYYATSWRQIEQERSRIGEEKQHLSLQLEEVTREWREAQERLRSLEGAPQVDTRFQEYQSRIRELEHERETLRAEEQALERERVLAEAEARSAWSPLPLSKILEATRDALQHLRSLLRAWEEMPDVDRKQSLEEVFHGLERLEQGLERPVTTAPTLSTEWQEKKQALAERLRQVSASIQAAERAFAESQQVQAQERSELIEAQRRVTTLSDRRYRLDHESSQKEVELARIDERFSHLQQDIGAVRPDLLEQVDSFVYRPRLTAEEVAERASRIKRLRTQMEWIGGIDPAVETEYQTTQERVEQLSREAGDVRQTRDDLLKVMDELDRTTQERRRDAFVRLNEEFKHFARTLFGGGEAELLEVMPVQEEGEEPTPPGIDIHVTPPGKRPKSITLLSGGERTLTAIALICAIMATNPSPFVVLDEVDAALDEANAQKFADIITSLSHATQFVIVTHNRTTMTCAQALYGVTMGDDGVSKVLSLKLGERP